MDSLGVAAPVMTDPVSRFAEDLFDHLPRADQRRWAESYLRGLLITPGRKSIKRLAASVSGSPTAWQSLQQFISHSPWDWTPARRALMRQSLGRIGPLAWTAATAVIPKRGEHSVGVHRRFVPEAGRTLNCQLGVVLMLSDGRRCLPVDWRLVLPSPWVSDSLRRSRTRIPKDASEGEVWTYLLELADALAGLPAHPLVADLRDDGDAGPLAAGLAARGMHFVVEVTERQPVLLRSLKRGAAGRRQPTLVATSAAEVMCHTHGHPQLAAVRSARDGRPWHTRVRSARVELLSPAGPSAERRTYRLISQEPLTGGQPRFWLTDLTEWRVDELVPLMLLPDKARRTVRQLGEEFGMLEFEGRSYPGWHHHMTLVSAAFAFRQLSSIADRAADVGGSRSRR